MTKDIIKAFCLIALLIRFQIRSTLKIVIIKMLITSGLSQILEQFSNRNKIKTNLNSKLKHLAMRR